MITIGFDAKRLFFNGSGLGNYSRSTVNILSRYVPDNEYVLFTPKEGNRYGFQAGRGTRVRVPSIPWSWAPSLWRSYGMSGDIRRSGVGIYHGLSNELPADIRRAGVQSVLTMHDIIFVHHPELYKSADRYLYTKKYGRSCRNADRIIAISRQTAGDLINYWNIPEEKIDVVYQGCDPVFAQKCSQEKLAQVRRRFSLPENFILSVGSIEARKNLLLTVKAIVEAGLDMDVVAVGRHTPYADEVMEYAVRHGVESRVRLLSDVPFADLPAVYQLARVFAYPSFYEGFGIPILEAFNSGIPVISTRGGVFAETGGDACLYVDPQSAQEMAEALSVAWADEQLRHDLTARGYAHAENFTEPVIAANLMKVYSSL